MKAKSASYWTIIILFAFVGFISWRVYFKTYVQSDSVSIHHFPKIIGDWKSEEVPISDDEKALLETDNVFVRRYTNSSNDEVFLFVVYSESNRKVSHPPEICYTGGGATILSRHPDIIPSSSGASSVDVHRLKIERGKITQIFAYWFKVGDTFTSSYWKQQALIAYKSLVGQRSSSALIRISSTVENNVDEIAIRRIKNFGQIILPHLEAYLP